MKRINIDLYSFNELSESAQNKIIGLWRYDDQYYWNSENKDSLKEFSELFSIRIKDYDYGYQNYINAAFNLDSNILELQGVRAAKWLYNNFKNSLYKPKTYYSKNYLGKRRNSKIQKEADCVFTGYYMDNEILGPLYDFIDKPQNYSIESVLNDCLNSWIKACDSDFQYWLSRESIIEDINCNDYLFLANGDLATKIELLAA